MVNISLLTLLFNVDLSPIRYFNITNFGQPQKGNPAMLRYFLRNNDGNIGLIFMIVIGPLLLLTGLSIDFLRAARARVAVQQAVDAASMIAAQAAIADPTIQEYKLVALARLAFAESIGRSPTILAQPGDLSVSDGAYQFQASATIQSGFLSIIGQTTLDVGKTSVANVDTSGELEIVLVLDNTGSMKGQKLIDLKSAAQTMVDTLLLPGRDNVRISVVPFSEYVNVGIPNRNKPWIDVLDDYTTTNSGCVDTYPNKTYSNCTIQTQSCTSDGNSSSCDNNVCDTDNGTAVQVCNQIITHNWAGCVGSRDDPDDQLDDNYTTKIPGLFHVTCPSTITPLSNNKSDVTDAIDNLVATGNTYIPTGLAWGWRALSEAAPFDQGKSMTDLLANKGEKVLILMTDGENTLSASYPLHDGTDETQSDDLTQELCTNIKDDQVKIYTIAFQVTDSSTKTMLETCASEVEYYSDPTTAMQLTETFKGIANKYSPIWFSR